MDIRRWAETARRAEREAHLLLSAHEKSASRVVLLEDLVKLLSGTPIDVQGYFREAVGCLEQGSFRAAIVMSWAGHFHVYVESLLAKHENDIRQMRKKWNFTDASELKESYPEAQILSAGKEVGFTSNAQLRILDGQLATRNQCAHPTFYKPSLNRSIGYVDEMVQQTFRYLGLK